MIKNLIVILCISNCSLIYAQTVKTDVLVIGGGASGVAAATQCARSKVKTILAAPAPALGDFPTSKTYTVETSRNIISGVWGEFRKHIKDYYKSTSGYDTAYNSALTFEPGTAASILKKMTDTIKNLTIYLNAPFTSIKKNGDKWEVSITQNEKTIKVVARVVIDATENGAAAIKAGAKISNDFNINYYNNGSKIYRTSIAAVEALPLLQRSGPNAPKNNYPPFPAGSIPMNSIVLNDMDNILLIEKALPTDKTIQYLPLDLELGQGAGTVAAYCAFFKTTTKNLKVRIIQGELLDFKAFLLPFADISLKDPDWRAIQQVCATGLLKGVQQANGNNQQFMFRPDSLVRTAEVQPVLTEIYTRAFLWFGKEKPGEKFTLGNLVSFISDYTLTDPFVLKNKIQKDWKTQYKFKPDFDLNRQVTRRQLAVLANKYLNPFARTIDLNGTLVN
jgi:hypothetical protein